MRIAGLLPIVTWLLAAGCVRLPQGPNVMVLPGTGKSFDQFTMDDAVCRRWAEQRIGESPTHTADTTAATGAAIGTVVGAAGGAAIGAAAGNPAMGAAAGAGAGLLGGSLAGATDAETARWTMQRRYDFAYMQCMYARGNQIPVPRGSWPTSAPPAGSVPTSNPPPDVPPPPPGSPPAPPPGM